MSDSIGFWVRRLLGAIAATIVFAVAIAGAAVPALALDTAVWSEAAPTAGAVVLTKSTAPRVVADDTAAITKATVTMNGRPASFVNIEFYVGHSLFDEESESDLWIVDDYTKARITGYFSSNAVVIGTNTIVNTVTSSRGVSTYTRTFTHGAATAISAVAPSDGAVIPASPAEVRVALSSGAASFTSAMLLDGVVVPSTYSASTKTFVHTPLAALSPGTHTVGFTAVDSSGGSVSKSWSFKVSPPMSDGDDCFACHSAYPAAHPVPDCSVCHSRGYSVPGGTHGQAVPTAAGCMGDGSGQQDDACHELDHYDNDIWGIWGSGPFTCSDCHSGAYPGVPSHTDVAADDSHLTTTGGCDLCHAASLVNEHGKYPVAATIKYQCVECHASTARQAAKDAIQANNTACDACHAGGGTHPGANHTGSDAFTRDYTSNFPVRWAGKTASYVFGCTPSAAAGQTICHDVSNLATLHSRLPDNGCAVCHGGGGATPAGANECLTCHGTGWYNPALSKGTVARPGSDFSTSGAVTRVGGSGADNFSTVRSNDAATSYLRFASTNAEAMFGPGFWWLNPNTASVTNVQVMFRAMKLAAGTTNSRMTVVLNVGGNTYVSPAAVSNPGAAAYALYTYTFATNPKTGLAWTPADLNNPSSANGLRAFGVRQTAADTANIGVTEVLLKVNTPDTNYTTAPKSGGNAHHYGDYLRSPETSAGVWSSAIYIQYCYDRCHAYPNTINYYGDVLNSTYYSPFRAYEGKQMWSSLMGDPNGNSPTERNLRLEPIDLPAGSSTLEFMTNYVLGTGDFGYVDLSTDGGSTWVQLEGTQGGTPVSVYTGTAGSWRLASYDLSAYAGQSVTLRFRYMNTAWATTAGWCIDNVKVSNGGVVLFSDDAETLRPEWNPASHWRRIQYALRWLG